MATSRAPEPLQVGVVEQAQAGPEEHRHDVEVELVGQAGAQELTDEVGAPDHLDGLGGTGGGWWVTTKMGTWNS
jgi:hypothetical protein